MSEQDETNVMEPEKHCWCGHVRAVHSLRQCKMCDTAGNGHIHRFAIEPHL